MTRLPLTDDNGNRALVPRVALLPSPPRTESLGDKLIGMLAKGASLRQALTALRLDPKRAEKILSKTLTAYGLNPAQARAVSLETLSLLSEELWAVVKRNPWRTAEFILRIEQRKSELMGWDLKPDKDKEEGVTKVSVQVLQNIILEQDKTMRLE